MNCDDSPDKSDAIAPGSSLATLNGMPQSEPLEILLPYDSWATGQMIAACEKLSAEQFHRRFEIGRGSLHDTVLHLLGAMKNWTQILAENEPSERLETQGDRSTEELTQLLGDVSAGFVAQAKRLPLDHTVSRMRDGKSFTFTRGAVLMQVLTHGVHHRAQCLNMLRQLSVNPLPFSSVTEWTRFGES